MAQIHTVPFLVFESKHEKNASAFFGGVSHIPLQSRFGKKSISKTTIF